MPAAPEVPATTAAEAEEAVEPEPDEPDEAEDGGAAESESASEQPAEPPPLCHELEFDPDDAAGFGRVDLSYYSALEASDEDFQVVATISPHPFYASAAAHDRDGSRRVHPEAREPQTLVVEITDTEGRTQRHLLPLDPPEVLPDHLHYAVIPEVLIIGPRGWMFAASGITYLSIRELIPGDFDEKGPRSSYVSDWPWPGESPHDIDGLYLYVHTGGNARGLNCFVSFEDLGISQADWYLYGFRTMKGYLVPDEYRGLFWHSEWGGIPVRSDLPESSGECCELFALNEGYALTTNNVAGGYGPRAEWPPKLFYSLDGVQWQEVALPQSDLTLADGVDTADMWVCSIEATNTGIRIVEGRSLRFDSPAPCDETREWTVDDDFSNWRLQEPGS
ncbi:hypothetical protein [Candidatus Poriferisodalis sp.]|uniref:hypothetical protein n=1 Tax=Candidatus Poriferisodalis sp. TaxID=3101277 RepID=UPI003AF570E8